MWSCCLYKRSISLSIGLENNTGTNVRCLYNWVCKKRLVVFKLLAARGVPAGESNSIPNTHFTTLPSLHVE